MIARRAIVLGALVALAACAAPVKVQEGPPAVPGAPAFEFRMASSKARPGWTEMQVRGGGTVVVSPKPVLRLEDIDNAALSKGDSPAVLFSVRPAARDVLTAETQAHIYNDRTNPDDWFAMLVDGHVAYIARLGLPLNRQVSVRIGRDALSKDEAERCIEAVRRQGGR